MTVPHWSASAVCRTIRTAKSWQNTEVAGTDASLISWKANWTDWRTSRRSTRLVREAKKNSRIRKELEESDKYRKRMYERIVNYDQEGKTEKAAANLPAIHPPTA